MDRGSFFFFLLPLIYALVQQCMEHLNDSFGKYELEGTEEFPMINPEACRIFPTIIVRSRIGWGGKRRIHYKGVETFP